jgi:EAL domain-containing protein (putative c-di-GMP-specific phosphodiesterase class I)/DNA-binding NarL/FixJ family response regulator
MFDLKFAKSLKVLYVEDEEYAREAGELLLKRFFKKVDTAKNGEEGLKKFNKNSYDIVITDLTMPKMDGITFIKAIKDLIHQQEIVVLTAHNDKEYILEAINLHVSGYILKPIDSKQLFSVLEKVFNNLKVIKEHETLENKLINKVNEKIKEVEQLLYYDRITHLPNFTKLKKLLKQKDCKKIAIIDISNFKKINAVFGTEIGDGVLIKLKEYLLSFGFKEVYKMPEASFAVILNKNIEMLCSYLKKFKYNENGLSLRFTFKIFTLECLHFTNNYYLLNSFLKEKKIKSLCKEFVQKEIDSIYDSQLDHQQWINRVIEAISSDRIVPFYQPIVDNRNMKVVKYESLIRMKLEDKYISPYFFLIPAKDAGIIQDLTKIMVDKSFANAKKYNIHISLNITQQDLLEMNFFSYLIDKRKEYELEEITLEVLEDIETFSEDILERVKELKKYNFLIAIDDFGSGYSNFQRVIDISPDFIKIDGSLIKNIKDKNFYNTIRAIKNFAQNIGSEVIAEFVEDEEILKLIKELNIEYSQGYYFSAPKLIKEFYGGI